MTTAVRWAAAEAVRREARPPVLEPTYTWPSASLFRGRVVGTVSRPDVVRAFADGDLHAQQTDEQSPA